MYFSLWDTWMAVTPPLCALWISHRSSPVSISKALEEIRRYTNKQQLTNCNSHSIPYCSIFTPHNNTRASKCHTCSSGASSDSFCNYPILRYIPISIYDIRIKNHAFIYIYRTIPSLQVVANRSQISLGNAILVTGPPCASDASRDLNPSLLRATNILPY